MPAHPFFLDRRAEREVLDRLLDAVRGGRVLPDPVDEHQIAAFLAPYGITMDELVNRMGGAL